MANRGFYCLDGYLKRTAKLSDQELGRLMRACMVYHATGEVQELTGRESVAFDFIREDIDAANIAYEAKCAKNRANAESRWSDANGCERIRPDANAENEMREDANQSETRNINEKEKEICINDDDNARALVQIQEEHNRLLDAAEDAGFRMSNDVRAALIDLYAEHGLQKMLDGLKSCVEHGVLTLAYLRACVKGKPKKAQDRPKVRAQDFGQRDYSAVPDDMMAALADEVAAFNAGGA